MSKNTRLLFSVREHKHTHTHIHTYTHTHTHIYTHTYTYTYVHIYAQIYILIKKSEFRTKGIRVAAYPIVNTTREYAWVNKSSIMMYVCTCTHIHARKHIYIYIYIYIDRQDTSKYINLFIH